MDEFIEKCSYFWLLYVSFPFEKAQIDVQYGIIKVRLMGTCLFGQKDSERENKANGP